MRKALLTTAFVAITAGALALGVTQSDKIKTFFASNEMYKNEQAQNAAPAPGTLAAATQASQSLTNSDATSLATTANTATPAATSTDTAAATTATPSTDTTTAATTTAAATPDTNAAAATDASTETSAGAPAMTPVDLGGTAPAASTPAKDDSNTKSSLGTNPLSPAQVAAANTPPAANTNNADGMTTDSKGTYTFDVQKALENRSVGSANAPLTVHDFSSLTCPHCAHFHNDIYPKLKAAYIDKGKVRWVFHSFPLNEPALKAEMVARCAPGGDDQYFKLTDFMFKNQERWAFTDQPVPNLNMLLKIAGVTDNIFLSCINNKDLENGLLKAQQEATDKYKIDSTPSFIFNDGLKKFSGVGSFEGFADDINHALTELSGPRAQKPLTADLPATTPAKPATDKK